MPKPELYVIFTGNKGRKPDKILLSEEFFKGADIDIEVKAKVIYESDTDDIINQYIIFCKVFNEQTKQHGMTQKAVTETIRICKDRNVLREYLLVREKEVVTIMMSLFDEEQIMKSFIRSERHDEVRETAERMIKNIQTNATGQLTPCLQKKIDVTMIGQAVNSNKVPFSDARQSVFNLHFQLISFIVNREEIIIVPIFTARLSIQPQIR